jgi:hypothetical protein
MAVAVCRSALILYGSVSCEELNAGSTPKYSNKSQRFLINTKKYNNKNSRSSRRERGDADSLSFFYFFYLDLEVTLNSGSDAKHW